MKGSILAIGKKMMSRTGAVGMLQRGKKVENARPGNP